MLPYVGVRAADRKRRTLIIVTGASGYTATIAQTLAARLRAHGHHVEVGDASTGMMPPPADYDTVLLGAELRREADRKAIAEYVRQHRDGLDEIPTGLFAAYQPDGTTTQDSRQLLEEFEHRLDWRPHFTATIACGRPGRARELVRQLLLALLRRVGGSIDVIGDCHEEIARLADSVHREASLATHSGAHTHSQ